MPRLTGTAARHFWIRYVSDQLDVGGLEPKLYKVQVSQRHIHWIKSMFGLTDAALKPDESESYGVGSGTIDLKPRKVRITNGTKSRYLVCPDPTLEAWKFNMITSESYATTPLEGESGSWHITGRVGEHESRGVPDYNGE